MIKNVDGNNLGNVWEKVAELVKKLTGDVELPKGNLQEQISELSSKTVHTDANQGLNDSQKEIARNNIGAPDSDHTHDGRYYTENEIDEKLSEKLGTSGDSKNVTTTFTSQDSTNITEWTDVGLLTSGEKHSSLFQKVATMFKNVRYLYHMLGTADISTLGEGADIGTVTGALSKLNSDIGQLVSFEYIGNAYENIVSVDTKGRSALIVLSNRSYAVGSVWFIQSGANDRFHSIEKIAGSRSNENYANITSDDHVIFNITSSAVVNVYACVFQ